jgi:hypothetical protein
MHFMPYSSITHNTTTPPDHRHSLGKIKLKACFYNVENLSFLHTYGIDNLYFFLIETGKNIFKVWMNPLIYKRGAITGLQEEATNV